MNVKTIALTGAEQAVSIGGSHAEVKNNGTDTIYASANSGIVAGADGVVSIPAGSAVTVLDTRGTVYLLGTGGAEIVGKDFVAPVFKPAATSGGAGGTEDEVARNAISTHSGNAEIHVTAEEKAAWSGKAEQSDIPKSLPANGGNAATATYQSIIHLDTGTDALDYIKSESCPSSVVTVLRGFNSPACPISYGYSPDDNDFFYVTHKLDNSWITVTAFDIRSNSIFTNSCLNGAWTGWVKISDGGNAASVGAYTEEKIAALEARIAALEGK